MNNRTSLNLPSKTSPRSKSPKRKNNSQKVGNETGSNRRRKTNPGRTRKGKRPRNNEVLRTNKRNVRNKTARTKGSAMVAVDAFPMTASVPISGGNMRSMLSAEMT